MLWSVIYNYPRAGLHVGLHASMSLVGSMGGAGATGYDARPVPRHAGKQAGACSGRHR